MSAFAKIKAIAYGMGIPSYPDVYPGEDSNRPTEWITYNYSYIEGVLFGDDGAEEEIESLQIHYFCPATYNFIARRREISEALCEAGFTHPIVTQAGLEDNDRLRHIVFECDIDTEREV